MLNYIKYSHMYGIYINEGRKYIYMYIYIYIYISIHSAANVITCARLRLKQMWQLTRASTKMKREQWTKRWNWSSCTKLALRGNLTHDLIAQSVRAFVRNSVVVYSNATQAIFLLLILKILQWWITYIYIYIYEHILAISCVG